MKQWHLKEAVALLEKLPDNVDDKIIILMIASRMIERMVELNSLPISEVVAALQP